MKTKKWLIRIELTDTYDPELMQRPSLKSDIKQTVDEVLERYLDDGLKASVTGIAPYIKIK